MTRLHDTRGLRPYDARVTSSSADRRATESAQHEHLAVRNARTWPAQRAHRDRHALLLFDELLARGHTCATADWQHSRGSNAARPLRCEPRMMKTINLDQLAHVSGGQAIMRPLECTPDNPNGAPVYTQQLTNPTSQLPPIQQRLDQAWQRSMGPWETFNGLFRGAGARAPRPPTLQQLQRP